MAKKSSRKLEHLAAARVDDVTNDRFESWLASLRPQPGRSDALRYLLKVALDAEAKRKSAA
jgi:hypothetical protein